MRKCEEREECKWDERKEGNDKKRESIPNELQTDEEWRNEWKRRKKRRSKPNVLEAVGSILKKRKG